MQHTPTHCTNMSRRKKRKKKRVCIMVFDHVVNGKCTQGQSPSALSRSWINQPAVESRSYV